VEEWEILEDQEVQEVELNNWSTGMLDCRIRKHTSRKSTSRKSRRTGGTCTSGVQVLGGGGGGAAAGTAGSGSTGGAGGAGSTK
jgi:hypothetical protein